MKIKIVAVFAVVFVGALFLEGATRLLLADYNKPAVVPPEVGQFDEMLGWSLKPLAAGVSNRTGYDIVYRINAKGLRDEETTYEKPEGIFRIVLLGDSRTFGFGVPIEKHFSTILEGYFKNVEIINMGVSGFGVDQALLYLQSEGLRYEPDVVLAYVAHYGDHRHMHTERWGRQKPRFKLVDGELMLTNSPVTESAAASSSIFQETDRWLVGYSKAYEIISNGLANLLRQDQQDAISQNLQDEKNLENDAFRSALFELGERLIFAMDEVASKHEAAFVLITHIEKLHEAALEKQILSLDVSGPLANKKYSLPDNLQHINESGNGVLAWEIATFLQANDLIPAEHLNDNKP